MKLSAMKISSVLLLFLLCLRVYAASPLQPAWLTCEYIENPLGIDTKSPRLGWTLAATERDQVQSAYEIIVSDNAVAIAKAEGNVWTTGKIISSQNIQVEYAGKPLQSFTRYYWRVKVYNRQGMASGWSAINWFETAMLTATDWKAQWINDGSRGIRSSL